MPVINPAIAVATWFAVSACSAKWQWKSQLPERSGTHVIDIPANAARRAVTTRGDGGSIARTAVAGPSMASTE